MVVMSHAEKCSSLCSLCTTAQRCGPIRLDQNHPQMSLAERRALLLMVRFAGMAYCCGKSPQFDVYSSLVVAQLDHEVDVVGTTHFFNDRLVQ